MAVKFASVACRSKIDCDLKIIVKECFVYLAADVVNSVISAVKSVVCRFKIKNLASAPTIFKSEIIVEIEILFKLDFAVMYIFESGIFQRYFYSP